jgi:hypothetical protein
MVVKILDTKQLVERLFRKVASQCEIQPETEMSYKSMVTMIQMEGNVYDKRTINNYLLCAQHNGLIKQKEVDDKTAIQWSFFPQERIFVLNKKAIESLLNNKSQPIEPYLPMKIEM